ncbi:hypothetical protein NliqN6_0917 [Naganishia liquefaciens]|uniref:Integral membrane protein n=1 Tax=Naganishia liquefaciens TaxID=104408 RepID=A0A8H3TNW2_9TREE|nr:hypothetical protein NliqN6_0917 [Naganishia liquefaciens]
MSTPPTHHVVAHSTPLRSTHLFNPTLVHLHPATELPNQPLAQSVKWSSRRARKARYAPRIHHIHNPELPISLDAKHKLGTAVIRAASVESKLKPHLDADVSFWIAVLFTLGSVVWVVNGFLVLLPIYRSSLNAVSYYRAAAATAFLGGTIFEVGSYLMVVEALNRGRETNFGSSLYSFVHSKADSELHQKHRRSMSEKTVSPDGVEEAGDERWLDDTTSEKKFVWWGKGLWHDIGYDAAYIQLWAATVFWVATITGLPGVIKGFPDNPSVAITDVFYWTPQVVGGSGFMLSAILLMLEVQTRWWKPALSDIGWHIGFWNLVGAVGFMICGAFGYSPLERWVTQSGLSTFWGSWAFLIGSGMQLYEVIWREPTDKKTA